MAAGEVIDTHIDFTCTRPYGRFKQEKPPEVPNRVAGGGCRLPECSPAVELLFVHVFFVQGLSLDGKAVQVADEQHCS
jgi:hypothetical protein